MPLHLLSKKSWNVYAPENIARVKRDQAEARTREEEEDRRVQEDDSARRLAVLRGEIPAPLPSTDAEPVERRQSREKLGRSENHRKRRRLHGEDDTDRDLRLAREDIESKQRRINEFDKHVENRKRSDAPIVDRDGHFNLFPEDPTSRPRVDKNAEVEAEKARKQREIEDQYTMRFSNAAGRDGLKQDPWYAAKRKQQRQDMDFVEGTDVWGRPDPSAKNREQTRQSMNDPLAFMRQAQAQLKSAERDKKQWQEEEQGKVTGPERHRASLGHHQSRDRERERGARRHHRDQGARGDREHKQRRKDLEHGRDRSKERSDGKRRSGRRDSISDVPDDLRLSR